jgi:hypothetical protein
MTALSQAGVTDLIDQTFENIRRGSDRQRITITTSHTKLGCLLPDDRLVA